MTDLRRKRLFLRLHRQKEKRQNPFAPRIPAQIVIGNQVETSLLEPAINFRIGVVGRDRRGLPIKNIVRMRLYPDNRVQDIVHKLFRKNFSASGQHF